MIKTRYENNIKMVKGDILFDKEQEEIIRERYSKGLDKRPIGRAVVQRKMMKLPEWPIMKSKLKSLIFIPEDEWNRKGQAEMGLFSGGIFNLFTIIIIAFLCIMFFAGLMYSMNLINGVLMDVGAQNEGNAGNPGYSNFTHAAEVTFGKATTATDGLRLVSMALIFSLLLGTIVMGAFSKVHPIMWVLHIFLTVLAIIFSVPVSNAYQNIIAGGGPFVAYIQMHTMTHYILMHLPIIIAIIGTIGSVFMFINILRAGNEESM